MRNLVRRYVTQEQRKAENEGVTEDDVNEIKNDISAFRFEMIEIMRASGMNTQSATGPSGIRTPTRVSFNLFLMTGPGGKKNRQKERRLMKGFLSTAGTVSASTGGPSPSNLSIATTNSISGSRSQLNSGNYNVPTTIHFMMATIEVLFEIFFQASVVWISRQRKHQL